MLKKSQKYLIAIDGGGAKTAAVFANEQGKIINQVKTGPSNPNKAGIEKAAKEISLAIYRVSREKNKEKIAVTYIALAGGTQRNEKIKKEIKNILKEKPEISFIFKGKVIIEGDEKAAFRAGTNKKNGIILIAGAGSLCCGWRNGKEAKGLGWDYLLGDEGSGFWTGQKALQAVCRYLDGRGPKTLLKDLIFRKLKIKNDGDLIRKVYPVREFKKFKQNKKRRKMKFSNGVYGPEVVKTIAELSPLVDKAAKRGDKGAKDILEKAGKELALACRLVIQKLNFQKEKFSIVLTGGMFKSKIVLEKVKKEIKKIASGSYFIKPKVAPVIGALKLALEKIKKDEDLQD